MKKIQSFFTFLFFGVTLLCISCNNAPPKGTIVLSKTEFAPNETIKINFTAEGKFGPNAWIGIIPSSTPHGDESKNDEFDLTYQYFEGITSGEMTFTAPAEPGDYDFRMHTTDNNGIEVTSISFKIVAPKVDVSLATDKKEYNVGDEILITFSAPITFPDNAWIGLIPSEIPHGSEATNDASDVIYDYLKKRTQGTLVFKAPDQKGSWDIRMNDSDNEGKEVASVTITIK